jgi:hypothetical protein
MSVVTTTLISVGSRHVVVNDAREAARAMANGRTKK